MKEQLSDIIISKAVERGRGIYSLVAKGRKFFSGNELKVRNHLQNMLLQFAKDQNDKIDSLEKRIIALETVIIDDKNVEYFTMEDQG